MKTFLAALAAVAVAVAVAAPNAVLAASAERLYTIQTRIVEVAPSVSEYDGVLQVKVSADGIVSGFYRPDDNPRFVAVTGGITGSRFWIDIGAFARKPLRFSGTFSDGRIDAQADGVVLDEGRYTGLDLIGTPKPE